MKIVQIIPSFNIGGGELLAVRVSAEIKRLHPDYCVSLVSLYDPIPSIVYDEAVDSGASIVALGKKKGFDPLVSWRLKSCLSIISPDVIHTHLAGLRYAIPAGLLHPSAVKVHTVHNMAAHETFGVLKQVHATAFRMLGWRPVALSLKVQQSIKEVYGLNAPIVNNGIEVKETVAAERKWSLRDKLRLPQDDTILIAIGRLCEQKNHALLLEAFSRVCRHTRPFTLLIVGDDTSEGDYRRMLHEKLGQLPEPARQRVHFLGPRKDIPELVVASDIFVLSSDWEGVPLTLLEAMGYGIPTVCTAVGGIPDVITDGVNGMLVPKGDADALAGAVMSVADDLSLSSTLVREAKGLFDRQFSIRRTAQMYLDLYRQG